MAREGQLAGETMAGTFDILARNTDSTRMPSAMHSSYLRSFCLEHRLARGQLQIAGRRVRLGGVRHPACIVGAGNDHIVPWKSGYASTGLLAGPARFVLGSGGHIAGIVTPPGPKRCYLAGGALRAAGRPPAGRKRGLPRPRRGTRQAHLHLTAGRDQARLPAQS